MLELTMLRRIAEKIPGHLPKAIVIGLSCWGAAAIFMGAAFACVKLGWHSAYMVAFAVIFICILGFMGSVGWFMVEQASGRVTKWRG
ncbi:MAG: hypothetical protein JNK71_10645 [Methyloversatilis sp.]|jgi:hypothetical protein|nr:hypothetical protein [Methyloversatilis sp.]